ncbi:hypothetical protein L596_017004 [Steinernema carpocapsae]|uniref:Uncharacterized protein n=1 Tax=Steinernema carpocapsae TaxID=34508 RepID=A0A4U5N0F1_STECR|nr:hypothetical protein L596_017004 [Steinernema carpocapsae]
MTFLSGREQLSGQTSDFIITKNGAAMKFRPVPSKSIGKNEEKANIWTQSQNYPFAQLYYTDLLLAYVRSVLLTNDAKPTGRSAISRHAFIFFLGPPCRTAAATTESSMTGMKEFIQSCLERAASRD